MNQEQKDIVARVWQSLQTQRDALKHLAWNAPSMNDEVFALTLLSRNDLLIELIESL